MSQPARVCQPHAWAALAWPLPTHWLSQREASLPGQAGPPCPRRGGQDPRVPGCGSVHPTSRLGSGLRDRSSPVSFIPRPPVVCLGYPDYGTWPWPTLQGYLQPPVHEGGWARCLMVPMSGGRNQHAPGPYGERESVLRAVRVSSGKGKR